MRIYYASDVHGSDVCWRKFLNAGTFYGASVLVMGGDLVGKAIVPIEMGSQMTATAHFHGDDLALDSAGAIESFEASVRNQGFYPYRGTREELAHLSRDDAARQELFARVVRAELERWFAIAEEKSSDGVQVFVMPGNDDPWFVDELIEQSTAISACDGQVVRFGELSMISLGIANRTPWDSIREADEDDLYAQIAEMAGQLADPERSVFNLHVPPHASGLDDAPLLDETLRPITRLGQIEMGPVGSVAVRRAILEYGPVLSLHGHIHEARAAVVLGRTLAINPGSAYSTGRIDGAVIDIVAGRVKSHQLVSG